MLRVIDTETCDLQGGIVEVASVDVIDGKDSQPHEPSGAPGSSHQCAGDGDTSHCGIDGGG